MSFFLRQLRILVLVIAFVMTPQFLLGESIASILEDAGVLQSFSYSFPPDSYGWYYNQYWDSDSLRNDNELAFYYSLFYFDPWPYEQGMIIGHSSEVEDPQPDFQLEDHIAVDDMEVYKVKDQTPVRVRRPVPRWHMPQFWNSCFNYSPVNHRIKVSREKSSTSQSGKQYHFYSSLSGGTVPGTVKTSGSWINKKTVGGSRHPRGYGLNNFQSKSSKSPGLHSTTMNDTYTKNVDHSYKGTRSSYSPSNYKKTGSTYSPSNYKKPKTPVYKETEIPVYTETKTHVYKEPKTAVDKEAKTPVYKKTKKSSYRRKKYSYKKRKTPSYKRVKPTYNPPSYKRTKPSYSYEPPSSSYKAPTYSNPTRQVTPYGGTSGSYQRSTSRTSRY